MPTQNLESWQTMLKQVDASLKTAEIKDRAFCENTAKFLNYLNGNQTQKRNKYKYVLYFLEINMVVMKNC